ncbi:MAG: hypothetical protein R2939_23105 [Kofleriaceae bacterium]
MLLVAALSLTAGCDSREPTAPAGTADKPTPASRIPGPRPSAGGKDGPPPAPKSPLGPVEYDPAAPAAPSGFGLPACDELRAVVVRLEACKAVAESTRQSARRTWETMAQRFSVLTDKPDEAKAGPSASCASSAETYARIASQAGC